MYHTILYISLPSLHSCDMKLPNFTCSLYGRSGWTQHKSCLFPLLNLDTVLLYSTRENFANICQIEWNWIRSMKFKAVRIHFLSDVFSLLSSKNSATMAMWRNHLPSLGCSALGWQKGFSLFWLSVFLHNEFSTYNLTSGLSTYNNTTLILKTTEWMIYKVLSLYYLHIFSPLAAVFLLG